jgi:hypothetical protein
MAHRAHGGPPWLKNSLSATKAILVIVRNKKFGPRGWLRGALAGSVAGRGGPRSTREARGTLTEYTTTMRDTALIHYTMQYVCSFNPLFILLNG